MANPQGVKCNMCGVECDLVTGDKLPGQFGEVHKKWEFLYCEPCKAWTGVIPNSNGRPSGLLANDEMRIARAEAHTAFAKVTFFYQERDTISTVHARQKAYIWLANKMMIPRHRVHISHMSIAQ